MLTDFHGDEAKKKNQNGTKTEFFNSANSQYFAKISGIGPWVSRIN